ncbi:(Fe-S)-binding protein [archaeon]|jgi:heterodisulfide reductase subunit D|nr:(Fe-S)-binding protein [archaeon]
MAKLFNKLFSKTLYYPGCLTKGVLTKEFDNYKEIFNKLGIDFVLLPDEEVCCGIPPISAGYKAEAKKLAQKNFDLFKNKKITKIITNCPSCYHAFNTIYPTLLRNWDIEVEHATISILNRLKKKKINLTRAEDVTYHDPCHLGRHEGIYEEPREVIQRLGGKIIEMKKNREDASCCGGGGGVRSNKPELAKRIAKDRMSHIRGDPKKIITPCGMCHAQIKGADERGTEFSTYVLGKLRGMRR